jgi:hypothetical protein
MKESDYLQAYAEISLLTVGVSIFKLFKITEPLNSPLLDILLIIIASALVLFNHYAILRTSIVSNIKILIDRKDLKKGHVRFDR